MSLSGFTPALWSRIKSFWSCPSVNEKSSKPKSQTICDVDFQCPQSRRFTNSDVIDQICDAKNCLTDVTTERLAHDQQMINLRKSYAMFCHEYENLLETYQQGFQDQSDTIRKLRESIQMENDHREESMKLLQHENRQLKKRLSAANDTLTETCDMTEGLFEQVADSVNSLLTVSLSYHRDSVQRQKSVRHHGQAVLTKLRVWKSKIRIQKKNYEMRQSKQKEIMKTEMTRSPQWHRRRFIQRLATHHRSRFGGPAGHSHVTRRTAVTEEGEEEDEMVEVRPEESISQVNIRPPSLHRPRPTHDEKEWVSESSETGISIDRLNELLEL